MLIPIKNIKVLVMMQVFGLKNTVLLHPFLTMMDGMTCCQVFLAQIVLSV
jgi:hypothetical protein